MAKLPVLRRFTKEDTVDAPPWWTKVLTPLNSFVGSVYAALNKGLTFQDNFLALVKVMSIPEGGITTTNPVAFAWPFVTRPIGCLVLQVTDTSATPAIVASAVTIDWTFVKGAISINSITGLDTAKTYSVTFLGIGG